MARPQMVDRGLSQTKSSLWYSETQVKTEEQMNGHVNKNSATLHFVELAASGRQTQSKSVGDRFKEGVNINLSLSVLRRVIRTLSGVNRRAERIPYRDSKLTLILRDSLGGKSRTAVIINDTKEMRYENEILKNAIMSGSKAEAVPRHSNAKYETCEFPGFLNFIPSHP
ncbi:unnamed protein product [Angiostrongylus costaricensis]|uniref:Kinesin motor domain-containing protein n=1 Tax=Angiostrongylus costaricensis TaxID=334426 RepID=A0A158PKX3_ANGCS|nr:unnamed protein product [Angiostrongylus costaricensis]